MLRMELNGKWKATYMPHNSPLGSILASDFIPEGWIDAHIPEDIHATLRRAGYIRGHFLGKDPEEDQWVEEADWVYYKEFYADKTLELKKVILEFGGIDTFCDIYLNGIKIGSGRNMFVSETFDVTEKLGFGKRNVLVVRIYSAVNWIKQLSRKGLFSSNNPDRLLVRKAQMNFGWDFCGRYVTSGIWKEVVIKAYDHPLLDSYYVYTKELGDGFAKIGLEVATAPEVEAETEYTLGVELFKGTEPVYSFTGGINDLAAMELHLENPSLWWPRPYGEQFLYDFRLTLYKNGVKADTRAQKLGIRMIRVLQEKEGDGISFSFEVNGRRLFIRGANWVPLDVVYTNITGRDYETLLAYAAEGNISMLRVWGGGIYESESFFNLCDQYGILIYQDFMYACGVYPQSEDFLENVYREAVCNIKKYRNRTSLAVWCGDNENDLAYSWDMRPYGFINDRLNRDVLKAACEREDPHRFYIPSSPCSPFEEAKGGDNPGSPYQGDSHLYLLSPFPGAKNYYKKVKTVKPRFISEFGFVSFPGKDSYCKFNFFGKPTEALEPTIQGYPHPDSFESFESRADCMIYYSQVYNSHCLAYWIEYFRTLKPVCSGCLYWKFNDPVADNNYLEDMKFPSLMSTVDFYKMPKMTYYYTKRAYEDAILVCNESEDEADCDIYLCSELMQDMEGTLEVFRMDFEGKVLWSLRKEGCTGKRDASTLLHSLKYNELGIMDRYGEYIKLEFRSQDRTLSNRYFLADVAEYYRLKLPPADLRVSHAARKSGSIYLTLKTENYARNVRINILDQDACYEDNYFDMDANSEKVIRILLRDECGINDKLLYIEGENVKRLTLALSDIGAES